jgi:ATP-dependent helicase HrpA
LLLLHLPSPRRLLRPVLEGRDGYLVATGPYETAEEWFEDCLGCALDKVLTDAGGPAWDGASFDALVTQTRSDLPDAALDVGEASLKILEALRQAELAAGDLPDRDEDAIADVVAQLARFVYPGFLTDVGAERLADVRRYVAAVAYRLQRLPQQRAKDREQMARVRRLEGEFDRIAASYPPSEALGNVAWMLQELRVSLFAQHLGTRGKVSEKRIIKAMEAAIVG